nr:cellulose biosynthesis cyclic di-GMP-binding regulatory protein BcsB [uncultured Gellertiella sp.]
MDNNKKIHGLALAAWLASVALFPGNGEAEENRLVPEVAAAPAAPSEAAAPVATATSLIPFEQAASSLVLRGEDDTIALTFNISEPARLVGGALQLAYTNAVSVLPDTATIEVKVNGKPAGSFPVRSPSGYQLQSIPVGTDALRMGRNRVEVRAIQHHRVDCSLDATYELWTRLSPDRSGFLSKAPIHFAAPMDLLAVGKTGEGFTDIRLIAPSGDNTAVVNQAMTAVQALALAMNRRDVMVSVAEGPGKGPGIDLYVGTATQVGQSAAARAMLAGAGPGLSVKDAAEPGRAVAILEGGSRKELDGALLAALRGPLSAALTSGVLAPQPGQLVARPTVAYTLADTGYQSRPFTGRLARTRFDIAMPADFYPAEYDTLNFFLSGATAPGLLPSAQLLVRVNDRVVTSFPFRNTDGETFRHKRIEMPLRAFRPGINRVELLAEVPDSRDAACQPGERTDGKPRFMMLQESGLEVPALARIGRLPDLGAFSGTAYPYAGGKPFTVMVDRPGGPALSVALTTVARLALSAGRPVNARLAYGSAGSSTTGDVLAVSTGGQPDASAPGTPAAVPPVAPIAGQDAVPGTDAFTTSATGHVDGLVSAGSEELLDAFQQSTAREGGRSANARFQDWLAQASSRFNSWLRYQDADKGELPEDANSLVTVSQRRAPAGDGVWTTIRAASPANLERGFRSLADPLTWEKLEGGTAIIRADTLELVTRQAEHRFVNEITDESFGNFRVSPPRGFPTISRSTCCSSWRCFRYSVSGLV